MLPALAQESPAEPPPASLFRVAVLTFELEEQAESRIGQRIAELLAEALAHNPSLQLTGPDQARRSADGSLPRMTELMEAEAATRLGSRLGADAAVTGQAYAIGERFYVIAKVVGCASGRVFGAGAEGPLSAPLPEIAEALAPGVDDLLAERRLELTRPGDQAREPIDSLKARVRALRRQKEPPPVILVVAEPEAGAGAAAKAAQDRLGQQVRRIGMTARAPQASDVVEWVRAVHGGESAGIPGSLRGQGMVLAMLLRLQPLEGSGTLSVAQARAEAVWLDARDGAHLASAGVGHHALAGGQETAAAAAARRVAQAVFEDSFSAALERWEARHRESEADAPGGPAPTGP